ncbi:MAG: alpha/beta fold hydrolase [Planctomycetota bacterium]
MPHRTVDPVRVPGLVLRDHTFHVPLDHAVPGGETIAVFAREVTAAGEKRPDLPVLLFLQGGPGFGAPRPIEASGWIGRAVRDFRVLLLDQRGTGRSTPVDATTLAARGGPAAQADYLSLFRADSIVRDAELVRKALLGPTASWTVLGQSYGGFCAVHYLCAAPAGLRGVITTGGLPPLSATCDEIYRCTYRLVAEKNHRYYSRYPVDVVRVHEIVDYLAANEVELPTGGPLTVRRFLQLGSLFGFSDGFETVHYLVEDAFVAGPAGRELSYAFRRHFENALSFDANPLYSILQEACYTQGGASNWSAARVKAEFPEFEPRPDVPVLFTGEMIYPRMFAEIPALVPLREAAERLAVKADWPPLYDAAVLAENRVPAAAAVYYDDPYVERDLSLETARAIRGARVWITNEYEHNGLRAKGDVLLDRLLAMLDA